MTKEFRLDVGDNGYYISSGKVVSGEIENVHYSKSSKSDEIIYYLKGTLITVREGYIFKTKEELLASL